MTECLRIARIARPRARMHHAKSFMDSLKSRGLSEDTCTEILKWADQGLTGLNRMKQCAGWRLLLRTSRISVERIKQDLQKVRVQYKQEQESRRRRTKLRWIQQSRRHRLMIKSDPRMQKRVLAAKRN